MPFSGLAPSNWKIFQQKSIGRHKIGFSFEFIIIFWIYLLDIIKNISTGIGFIILFCMALHKIYYYYESYNVYHDNHTIQAVCKKIFWLKQKKFKYFCTSEQKVLCAGVKQIFWIYFFHKGIRNKKFGKVKNVQVWVARRFFEQRAKHHRGKGVQRLPHGLEG